jgi:hypothetical protein
MTKSGEASLILRPCELALTLSGQDIFVGAPTLVSTSGTFHKLGCMGRL